MQGESYYNRTENESESSQTYYIPPRIHDVEAQQRLVSGEQDNEDLEKEMKPTKNSNRKWGCLVFLAVLLTGWAIWTLSLSRLSPDAAVESNSSEPRHIDFEDIFKDDFIPIRSQLEWVKNGPQDGVYTYRDPATNDILLESVEKRGSRIFVKAKDLIFNDFPLEVSSFEISQDSQYVMLVTDRVQQWRYSYRANIYIYSIADKTIFPLTPYSTVAYIPQISYAAWSPTGHQLAYVMENDIYTTDLRRHRRITFDGSATVFNGVPDWVYEEEIFATNFAFWWSPDSSHLAFLRFNETDVPEYTMQLYTASDKSYPDEIKIKYPKAGSPNPIASLHVHSLVSRTSVMVTKRPAQNSTLQSSSLYKEFEDNNRLITDVIWATDTNTSLLFKQTNRVQDHEITSLVTIAPSLNESRIDLVSEYIPEDKGWIESGRNMVFLETKSNGTAIQYLDISDNGNGFMHLALFTAGVNKDPTPPLWLTFGEWEVVPGTVVVDKKNRLVHFMSTERSHLERHLYTISLNAKKPASTKKCITCPKDPKEYAYYDTKFSPMGGYFLLNYLGPHVPTAVVRKVSNSTFENVVQDNHHIKQLLKKYELPRKRMVRVKSGGVEMTAMELLPPDFDITQHYPVIFNVYGGPGSQLASYQFELNWHSFLASQLKYIVVTVDGRGTGFKGRKYKVGVRGRLGELEAIDQINAAKHWSNLDYVDKSRIAIWGWSFGGFLTSKVVEANSGLFSAAMAVAPVTDWRFYDSFYTERYMKTPEMNPKGYIKSAVNNMTGFSNTDFLLAHGTGDDNVHFQNSAVLIDKLTKANVRNYRVQFFTDSNHAIQYHNANKNLYYLLTEFLWKR
ncbi:dipeptidyl peptidase IV N-terminal region-domain-containing protein [Phycomyces nitens]|nr:dipeptidyl peptidase IV N-terminal region-domain-containing protein [Phycomyces nitens]